MRKTVVLIAATLAIAGCGRSDPTAVTTRQDVAAAPHSGEAASRGCPWDDAIFETVTMGINQLANISEAAFVGTVTAIAPARWNSKDGSPWCPPSGSGVRPMVYRDVTVKIGETIYGSEQLDPRTGDEVVVRTFGDGASDGPVRRRFEDGSEVREGEIDGPFEVGKEVLLIVSVAQNFPSETGTEVINQVTGGWAGNWEVDRGKDVARNVEPGRTVPFRALVARLAKERQDGRKPERDDVTRKSPLADPDKSAPASTAGQSPPAPKVGH